MAEMRAQDYIGLTESTFRCIQVRSKDYKLKCEQKTFDLNEHSPYRALSYCWGDDAAEYEATLNGRPTHIRANLRRALEVHAFEEDSASWLFVDALYIDQNNEAENSAQVMFMREIYCSATEVIIWLGLELAGPLTYQYSYSSFTDDIARLSAIVRAKQASESHQSKRGLSEVLVEEFGGALNLHHVILLVFMAKYWTRLWIVQEFVLAQEATIYYHDAEEDRWLRIDWSLFAHVLDAMMFALKGPDFKGDIERYSTLYLKSVPPIAKGEISPAGLALLLRKSRERAQESREPVFGLATALSNFCSQDCLVTHDKVYGLLGLVNSVLRPNYLLEKNDLYVRVLLEAFMEVCVPRRGSQAQIGNFRPYHKMRWAHDALSRELGMYQCNTTFYFLSNSIFALFSYHPRQYRPLLKVPQRTGGSQEPPGVSSDARTHTPLQTQLSRSEVRRHRITEQKCGVRSTTDSNDLESELFSCESATLWIRQLYEGVLETKYAGRTRFAMLSRRIRFISVDISSEMLSWKIHYISGRSISADISLKFDDVVAGIMEFPTPREAVVLFRQAAASLN